MVDEGEGARIMINERPTELGGRGLKLVEGVSLQWGAREGTTHVWADVAV